MVEVGLEGEDIGQNEAAMSAHISFTNLTTTQRHPSGASISRSWIIVCFAL